MDSRYKKLGKNTFLVFLGTAGSKLITLLMLPYYTRMLSTAAYGISDLVYTYSSIMLSVVTCCIADAIFIFPKNADEDGRKRYFTSGIVFSVVSFALWATITGIVGGFGGEGTISKYAWWIYGLTLSTFIQYYMQQFSLSIERVSVYSITGIINVACIAGFAFLLMPGFGLIGYLLSMIIANIVAGTFSFIAAEAYKYFDINSLSKPHLTELLKYGVPLIPNTIMWWIVNGINRPILEANLGLDAVGIYAVANKFPAVLTMLFTVFSNAWIISMLEEFEKPDFNSFFNKTVKVLFYGMSLFTVFFILCSKIIVTIFAAPEFYEAWRYMPILTVGILLSCMSGLIGGIFSAEKKSKYFFYSSIWGAASSLVLTLLGVKFFGLMGVCVAVAVSFLIMVVVRLKYAWKYINLFDLKYYAFMFLLILCSCVAMIVVNSCFLVLLTAFTVIVVMYTINRNETQYLLKTAVGYLKNYRNK